MSADLLFQIVNTAALVAWLALILGPRTELVRLLIRSYGAPLVFALVYLVVVVFKFGQAEGGFDSLANVMSLFRDPWATAAAWTHFLAFDLFVGIWIVNDAETRRVSHLLTVPCLVFTFMLGPIGLLGHIVVRSLARNSIPLAGFIQGRATEFLRRDPIFTKGGLLLLLLGGICIGLAMLDQRLVDHSRVWLKPAKFYFSIGIYFLTLAWILGDLKRFLTAGYVRFFTIYSFIMAGGELGIITLQATRGIRSHYNNTTALNSTLYAVMGLLIFINMLVVAHLGYHWWRAKDRIRHSYWLGTLYGFVIFTAAGAMACVMSSLQWSRIGAYDPSTLVPFLGWNQAGGDLRISHFVGIHALQVMAVFGSVVGLELSESKRWVIHLVAAFYLTLVVALFTLGMMGLPVLR